MTLTAWIDSEVQRFIRQDEIAKCYVAIAEIDYDLREWEKALEQAYATDQVLGAINGPRM